MADDPAQRLLIALELHELGLEMMKQRLRREDPDASEAQLHERLAAWLHDRPGDAEGRVVPWPRVRP